MFLLDTNVVSDMRKVGKRSEFRTLGEWVSAQENSTLFISSITQFELELGVQRMERRDPKQGNQLRQWLSVRVAKAFDGRVLPFDIDATKICASFHVPDPASYRDAFIAAIAATHHLTIVTRNTRDFKPMGVACLDPYDLG